MRMPLVMVCALVSSATACSTGYPPTPEDCAARVHRTDLRVTAARPADSLPLDCGSATPLARDASGEVPCLLDLVLPPSSGASACEAIRGATSLDANGGTICRLAQQVPSASAPDTGWYWDDFSPDAVDCPRVVVTDASWPPVGSELRLECLVDLRSNSDGGC